MTGVRLRRTGPAVVATGSALAALVDAWRETIATRIGISAQTGSGTEERGEGGAGPLKGAGARLLTGEEMIEPGPPLLSKMSRRMLMIGLRPRPMITDSASVFFSCLELFRLFQKVLSM